MADRAAASPVSTVDVLERVLDKGIVIDAQIDIAVAGISLINVNARVLVSSFRTYLRYADALAASAPTMPLPPLTSRAVLPPAGHSRPALRGRQRRARRAARVTLACARGCTFLRNLDERQSADSVSCPYRSGTVCVLKPAA
jgi:gas vesicle structural protein